MKIATLAVLLISIIILMFSIKTAYKIKYSIDSIKNRKSYVLIILNMYIAIAFTIGYSVFTIDVFAAVYHSRYFLISLLFFLSSIFVYITAVVTYRIGLILYDIDKLRKLDHLTKIYNRGYLEHEITQEFSRASRYNRSACLIIMDVDRFKSINDNYGHVAGDKVLVDIAETLLELSRTTDTIGRYGGDEFIIIMPETDIKRAQLFIERIKKATSNKRIATEKGDIGYSLSYGISEINQNMSGYIDWVDAADKEMYVSKNQLPVYLS